MKEEFFNNPHDTKPNEIELNKKTDTLLPDIINNPSRNVTPLNSTKLRNYNLSEKKVDNMLILTLLTNKDLSLKEKVKVFITIRGQNSSIKKTQIAVIGTLLVALIYAIAQVTIAIIENTPQSQLASSQTDPVGDTPIGFTEDYTELLNIYNNCLNEYNESKFHDKYDDAQSNYLTLVNIYTNCLNEYNNHQLIEFVDSTRDYIDKSVIFTNELAKIHDDFTDINNMFKDKSPKYVEKLSDFKDKYVDILIEHTNAMSMWNNLIGNADNIILKIYEIEDKMEDVKCKNDDIMDKASELMDKADNIVNTIKSAK